MTQTKILLADDHAIVRDGLRLLINKLSDDITVAYEAGDGRDALELVRDQSADLYIFDVGMPGLNGIETTERLRKLYPGAKVIILSMYAERLLVEKAISAGARAYVLKDKASAEIGVAIEAVLRGESYFSPEVAEYAMTAHTSTDAGGSNAGTDTPLTTRQREILQLICEGMTEREIAEHLNISPHTVHVHKNNIMRVLDIHSQAGLVRYGIQKGIVQV
jgi:DNA-binding NarL/FixJ family response regulator